MEEVVKVLVFGAKGMAGYMISKYLRSRGHYVVTVSRDDDTDYTFSIRYSNILAHPLPESIIQKEEPDVVINAVGLLVQGCKDDILSGILVNTAFPHMLEYLSGFYKFKLIHISTDCVFSGKVGNYKETDQTDGEDNYAKTKALGEVTGEHSLTLRTSIIGPELKDGTGLLHWFLKQDECEGWVNAFWSGVTTLELAKAIDFFMQSDKTGFYHLTSDEKISKYDLLKLIAEVYGKDTKISRIAAPKFCDKSLLDTIGTYTPPSYYDMLTELRDYE